MGKVDMVIEVLDARVPHSSCNPVFETLRRQGRRPALKLLNKTDAADPEHTRRWLLHYNAQPGVTAIGLCAKAPFEVRRIPKICRGMLPNLGTPAKPLRMMILGIPNVGKSTVMNALLNRHVANVGDEPAITKIQMFHKLGPGMSLVDTPGMLWPGIPQDVALKLAATHSIGRAAYDDEGVAVNLAQYLIKEYHAGLAKRFGAIPAGCDGNALLTHIANVRVFVKKGAEPDLHKAATALLNDFRNGDLGPVTLETVEQFAANGPA